MTERPVGRDGVVFVAFGLDYVVMALNAVHTLRRFDQATPVAIVSNVARTALRIDPAALGITSWQHLDMPTSDNRLIKTSIASYSPFDRTIMVDCDVEFVASPAAAFDVLDTCDVAVLERKERSPSPSRAKGRMLVFNGKPASEMPHWNSGIVLFERSPGAEHFFTVWHDGFIRAGVQYDQISYVEAVMTARTRIHELNRSERSFVTHYLSRMPKETELRCREIAAAALPSDLARVARAGVRWKTRRRVTRLPLRPYALYLLRRTGLDRLVA
jgi:hypothetical protein